MRRYFSTWAGLAWTGLLLGSVPAGGVTYSNIYAFGDSLTDVGNAAGVTQPGVAPVINGYYNEEEFSDGILWNQYLANYWGLPAQTVGRGNTTTQTPEPGGSDWAYAGAAAGTGTDQPTGVTQPIPQLLTQVSTYLQANTPASSALYAVWSGADNLLVEGDASPAAADAAAASVTMAVQELNAAGAQHFLVFNLPDIGDTPYAQAAGPATVTAAQTYSVSFDNALTADLAALQANATFTGDIHAVNVYAELKLVVTTVDGGGTYTPDFFVPGGNVAITNVTGEALDYFNANGTYPTNYLFWDDVHPTTEGQDVLAGLAIQALPEPGAWGLLAGAGAIACAVGRRKTRARL
jgi:phospholipase/lecithinase/hemolysin